jgi:hypothetical protein
VCAQIIEGLAVTAWRRWRGIAPPPPEPDVRRSAAHVAALQRGWLGDGDDGNGDGSARVSTAAALR